MAEDKTGPNDQSAAQPGGDPGTPDEPTKRFDADTPNPAETPEPTPAPESEVAADTTSDTTPVSPDPEVPPQPKQRSNRLAWVAAAVATVVAIAAIATSVVFYLKYQDAQDVLDAQSEARDAMCDYAKTVVTYDYNDLDTFFTNVLDGATGQWHDEFDANSKALRDPLVAGQVRSSGDEVQCGVQSGDTENAVIVVAIGQTITSLGTQNQPQQGQISLVATMENVDGKWLVSKMDAPLLKS
ncbi:hypothetical protein OG921_07345 [Aldersonia sp. NBC_00410]|uniref:hypothetical protein n=1 Tax=Aldersonia sp. NBC_00410 TaxID=2975954 RepID=UPI0022587E29|nr:hypothetical protein [Aldersonia sp. NBC_00410]MCX5042981.1 hypothetical protein [Aldersonia sp. NBC_00410]